MIEVKTTENAEKFGFDPSFATLEVVEKGESLGAISVSADSENNILYIHALKCADALLADFLIRSAAAYGDNRYCIDMVCLDKENQKTYDLIGFIDKNGQLTLPVNKLVHKTSN